MNPGLSRDCESVHLTALGVPFVVEIEGKGSPRLAALVRAAWSRCLDEDSDPEGRTHVRMVLTDEHARVSEARRAGALAGPDDLELMHALSPRITTAAIASNAGRLLMLHAGAVADPASGRSVALVGPSGAGKTTAVRRLAAELAYVTDETFALDADDHVVPYPKPLSILDGARTAKSQVSPDVLRLHRPEARCRLVSVVVLERRADAPATPTLEDVPVLAALAALAPETSSLALLPRPLHRLAGILDRVGGLQRLRYRDAEDLVPLISELVGAR